jgi:signal transduction histidine kinase
MRDGQTGGGMNPYNYAASLFAFGTFFVALLIWLKRLDRLASVYFLFSLAVSLWSATWSVMVSDNVSYNLALWSSRFAHTIGGFCGILWYHFTLVLTNTFRQQKKILFFFYGVAVFSICFIGTPWYVPNVISRFGFRYYTHTGLVLDIYMVVFTLSVLMGFWILWQAIQSSSAAQRHQLLGLFIATGVGFLGGFSTIVPIYGIQNPQYLVFLMPVYPFVMAYFMMRHRLFDVEQAAEAFQREKLATIGLIASSINHEIRNPLYIVKGLLESYRENKKEGFQTKDPDEVTEKALNNVNRALDVITKLNRFAKPMNEQSAERIEHSANIPEAINTVLDLISYEFELDNIHIKNEINPDVPNIQCDQRQLEEILFNLITNACHAIKSKGKGELRIGTILLPPLRGRIEAGGHPHPVLPPSRGKGLLNDTRPPSVGRDSRITLIIQDTGSGIPKDRIKHLFEPFHTTKGEQGTGLGLYITKQLIERNQGKITVKSEEGKGTMFVLEFKEARKSPV